jgi:hypothetical protein
MGMRNEPEFGWSWFVWSFARLVPEYEKVIDYESCSNGISKLILMVLLIYSTPAFRSE